MTRHIARLAIATALAVAAVCSSHGALAGKVSEDVGRSNTPIFTTKEKIIFTLKTDFGELWKHRAPPNTEVPDDIKDFETPGWLSWRDKTGKHDLPVDVHLRGNTSQSEAQCPFPK